MTVQWKLPAQAPPQVRQPLCDVLGLHPLVAEVLAQRGIDSPEAARRFMQPSLEHLHDPFLLKGMAEAVTLLADALTRGRRIVISGDYDVDGVTATTLLYHFLRAVGAEQVDYFIPNRFDHGYGLTGRSAAALRELRPELVLTVDNGITAVDEVAGLRAAGIETIVTDHHLPRAAGVPAGIVVNPRQPGCAYPFKGISGCGVAFKLATALRKHLREAGWFTARRPEPNLRAYLDLAAIGTVADVVPLTEENRIMVHHGLALMNRGPLRPGLAALAQRARVEQVDARAIAFRIAPRLNAAGRMADGALGVALLLCEEAAQAGALADRLEEENERRRSKGQEMLDEALGRIRADGLSEAAGIVVASERFHEGIIGIVAAKVAETFHRPTVVLAENGASFKGSARSVPGFNVTAAIAANAGLLEEYGGHAGAGGCKLPKAHLEEFRAGFARACAELAPDAAGPSLLAQGLLAPGDCVPELVSQLQRLAPFGHENEEPLFILDAAHLPQPPVRIGSRHLKWQLGSDVEMVAWGMAGLLDQAEPQRFLVRLEFNEFRGRRKVQLVVSEVAGATDTLHLPAEPL